MVFDYYASVKDFFQQGETANEAARVCIDSGDLDTAYKWYQTGHDSGLREPNIKPDRADLWEFRWEHAQARIAARRSAGSGTATTLDIGSRRCSTSCVATARDRMPRVTLSIT
jgi:hypothetical protein